MMRVINRMSIPWQQQKFIFRSLGVKFGFLSYLSLTLYVDTVITHHLSSFLNSEKSGSNNIIIYSYLYFNGKNKIAIIDIIVARSFNFCCE